MGSSGRLAVQADPDAGTCVRLQWMKRAFS